MKLSFATIFAVAIVGLLYFLSTPRVYACIPYSSSPNLYEVDRISSSSATLYFTPLNDFNQGYTIYYGLTSGDSRYNVNFSYGSSDGAITYTINALDPAFTYYYAVSATNDCSQSPLSNWMSDAIPATGSAALAASDSSGTSVGPVAGSETLIIGGILSALLVMGGFGLFKYSKNYA